MRFVTYLTKHYFVRTLMTLLYWVPRIPGRFTYTRAGLVGRLLALCLLPHPPSTPGFLLLLHQVSSLPIVHTRTLSLRCHSRLCLLYFPVRTRWMSWNLSYLLALICLRQISRVRSPPRPLPVCLSLVHFAPACSTHVNH